MTEAQTSAAASFVIGDTPVSLEEAQQQLFDARTHGKPPSVELWCADPIAYVAGQVGSDPEAALAEWDQDLALHLALIRNLDVPVHRHAIADPIDPITSATVIAALMARPKTLARAEKTGFVLEQSLPEVQSLWAAYAGLAQSAEADLLKEQLFGLHQTLEHYYHDAEEQRRRVDDLYRSTSWRISAPVRWLKTAVSR